MLLILYYFHAALTAPALLRASSRASSRSFVPFLRPSFALPSPFLSPFLHLPFRPPFVLCAQVPLTLEQPPGDALNGPCRVIVFTGSVDATHRLCRLLQLFESAGHLNLLGGDDVPSKGKGVAKPPPHQSAIFECVSLCPRTPAGKPLPFVCRNAANKISGHDLCVLHRPLFQCFRHFHLYVPPLPLHTPYTVALAHPCARHNLPYCLR